MKIEIHGLSEDQTIRRFVELPKLFELLIAQRVFFPTVGTLKSVDPFECGIPVPKTTRKMLRSALKSEATFLLQYLPRSYQTGDRVEDYQRHEKLLNQSKIAELRQHVSEIRLMLLRSRIVCNCWHLSDCESDAMWKLYGSGTGVMIVSTVKRLRTAIKGRYSRLVCSPNPQAYSIAPVQYVDEKDTSKLSAFYLERPWLLKRTSFAHEREIRVSHELPWMIIDPEADGMLIDIEPRKLISEIILSPFNPSWADWPIAAAIEIVSQQSGVAVPIRRSDHMKPPVPKSRVLASLEFLKFRDVIRGSRLRMERLPDYKNLNLAKKTGVGNRPLPPRNQVRKSNR